MTDEPMHTGANGDELVMNAPSQSQIDQKLSEANSPSAEPRQWLSVDEAFIECQAAGLNRTKKTIRSWCRNGHVDGQKQSTSTGERWMVEAVSLGVKIRAELEFQREVSPAPKLDPKVSAGANGSEPVRVEDRPVRTSAHGFEPGQTSSNGDEPGGSQHERHQEPYTQPTPNQNSDPQKTHNDQVESTKLNKRVQELEREVRSLEIDKAVRDRHVEFLNKQTEDAQKQLLGQSRYIGHLETNLLNAGGRPDQQFLSAPTAATTPARAKPEEHQYTQSGNAHSNSGPHAASASDQPHIHNDAQQPLYGAQNDHRQGL